ncbi:hypothetical protein C8J56DRAFT_1115915 [Mycena floridula]|nr:hypothetical protein C8J56DRAFT_1115915 [Mycena floridula]
MRSTALLVGILASFTAIATPIADKVLVPGSGFQTKTNIHEIPAGANDTIVHTATVGSPAKVKSEFSREETGWITFASWLNTGSSLISSFTTTWTVPPVPAENHSQTTFLFNSIQPTDSAAILQPVLQYGPSAAGGGAFWVVATCASDYPAGSTVFSGIDLELEDGTTPDVSWSPVNDDADGLSTTINTDDAINAVMTIEY